MAGEGEVRAMQETANSALKLLLELMRMHRESKARQSRAADKDEYSQHGEVNYNELKTTADKKGETLSYQEGISEKYLPKILEKAEDYGISVAVVPGNNPDGHSTLAFRTKDKEAFNHIIGEVVKEEMTVRPEDFSAAPLKDWEVTAMQAEIDNGNVAAAIVKNKDGEYLCVYENSEKPKMDIVNNNFIKTHTEITESFGVKNNADSYVLEDKRAGKQLTLDKSETHSASDIISRLTKDFGYNETKATMAAWNFAGSLPADKQQEFFEINALAEIKLEGEFEINREIGGTYTVKLGEVENQYTLDDDSVAKLQEDFGIPEEKANAIYGKACEQNAVEEEVEQILAGEEITEEVEIEAPAADDIPDIEVEELEFDMED
jgi:hypothetical protein